MLVDDRSFRRPACRSSFTLKEKRSEFIADLFPAADEDEARRALEQIRREHFSATHNCPAWRVGCPELIEFSSDDGEPAGTAGRPILGALQKAGMGNAALIVTRYFGGVKLGVRGLIDAYTAAAEGVIAQAQAVRKAPFRTVQVFCDYPRLSDVNHLLRSSGIPEKRIFTAYAEQVTLTATVSPSLEEGLRRALSSYEGEQLQSAPCIWSEDCVLCPED